MVRKQLYLEEAQDNALKRRARELGVSEAEVVRRALDTALSGDVEARVVRGRREILGEIFRIADEAGGQSGGTEPYKFDREALYDEDERFARWANKK